jgi:hypothetical protein
MPKSILKSNEEIYMMLTLPAQFGGRPAKTAAGKKVQASIAARVEIAMMIASELAK